MSNQPTLTPLQALAFARENDGGTHDGWVYCLDGPRSPYAVPANSDNFAEVFYCSGELDEPVTEQTQWIGFEV